MKATCWLTIGKGKRYLTYNIKSSNKKPSTKPNEIAIKIELDIPDSLFERPQLQAKIRIDPVKSGSSLIDADVIENLAEVIKQETGLNMHITVGSDALNEKLDVVNLMGN